MLAWLTGVGASRHRCGHNPYCTSALAEIRAQLPLDAPLDGDREVHVNLTDSTRTESPLIRPADAIVVDTTELSPEQVVEQMLAVVETKLG